MSDIAKILSYSMVSKALLDTNFYTLLPEFATLKNKLQLLKINIAKPTGCSGCQKRRVEANMFKDFLSVVQTLDADGIKKFKEYFKINKLMLNIINPQTKAVEFKVI
ncbi:hypothetical protein ACFLQL_00320 [Verrucomicrobiota bacterium]